MPNFADIVDDVTSLTLSEMEEIKRIIEKVLSEKKREQLLQSGNVAREEYKHNKLKFYDSPSDLMNTLNEPD